MFTGIIEEIGEIKSVRKSGYSAILEIGSSICIEGTKKGDSISVNGICLTVTHSSRNSFFVDVMPDTMNRTDLGSMNPGDKVNLERAARLGDRLGGHIVSGHINCTGIIRNLTEDENAIWIEIELPEGISRYIVEKGSVAIDGISLTVGWVSDKSMKVSVIPHTRKLTTLCSKKDGDLVNIETDMIAKYVEKMMAGNSEAGNKYKNDIDLSFLQANGYL